MFNKIEDTNRESLLSKKSAFLKGYFSDDFIDYFCQDFAKKEVILNWGYWIRWDFFQRISEEFIRKHKESQIVSLGAGLDTIGFNLLKKLPDFSFKFFEVDQIETVNTKIKIINRTNELKQILGNQEDISESILINTKNYQLSFYDLEERDI